MAIDLSKMSEKELAKLEKELEKEVQSRAKGKREAARKAADAAAQKHGFSLNDLVGTTKAKAKGKKQAAPAKYKNPKDPKQTWSGRGRQPVWFKEAVSAGADPKSLEA